MSENKTRPTKDSVKEFLNSVEPEQKRLDSFELLKFFEKITGEKAVLWGSIVGFGQYHYRYESGCEGDMPLTGFSPRKQAFTLYIMDGFDGYQKLLDKLGKHSTGKSCLYIKKLADIDMDVLAELVRKSNAHMVKTNT